MNDYARSLPHLGFDPAPGDVGLTQHLARRHYQVAAEARQVLAAIEKLDLHALQGRTADAMRALQATFPPALRSTASAAETLHAATASWANQLSEFQAEADALEREAADASAQQQALQAKQAALPPGSPVLTADVKSASAAVSGIQGQAQELHQRYLAAAAKTAGDVGEHSGLWDRTEPVRTVLEAVLAPLDIVAADHWVSALEKVAAVPSEWVNEAGQQLDAIEAVMRAGRFFALSDQAEPVRGIVAEWPAVLPADVAGNFPYVRKFGPLGWFYRYVLLSRDEAAGALAELTIAPPRRSGEAVASAWLVSAYHPDRKKPFSYRLSVRGDGIRARLDGSGLGDSDPAGTSCDIEGLRWVMLDLITRPS